MKITVAARKGGVGKTTTAVHLAAYLATTGNGQTVLVDGDPNRSALKWAARGQHTGKSLPFACVDVLALGDYFMEHGLPQHLVIDTKAHPDLEDLDALARHCDLMVIPSTPDALSLDTLPLLLNDLRQIEARCQYAFLLTAIPPHPSTSGKDARQFLSGYGAPLLSRGVRRFAAFEKAPLEGCAVNQVKGDRNAAIAWRDYCAVSTEILSLSAAHAT